MKPVSALPYKLHRAAPWHYNPSPIIVIRYFIAKKTVVDAMKRAYDMSVFGMYQYGIIPTLVG